MLIRFNLTIAIVIFSTCLLLSQDFQSLTPISTQNQTSKVVGQDVIDLDLTEITILLAKGQILPATNNGKFHDLIKENPEKLAIGLRRNLYPLDKFKELVYTEETLRYTELENEIITLFY